MVGVVMPVVVMVVVVALMSSREAQGFGFGPNGLVFRPFQLAPMAASGSLSRW